MGSRTHFGEQLQTHRPQTAVRVGIHIDVEIKSDTPLAFGMHPNAEIGFRTDQATTLFRTLMELQPKSDSGESGGESELAAAKTIAAIKYSLTRSTSSMFFS